jgi:uncharacterized lipoprotein NlpE involved in copper resistance
VLLLALAGGCSLARPDDPGRAAVGVYQERLPAADAAGRIVTLWLEADGTAILETVYVGRGKSPAARGRWSVRGQHEVAVTLLGSDGRAAEKPLIYELQADRLVPVDWDRRLYGEAGLPLRRR